MSAETARLEAELKALKGKARAPLLFRLGQAHWKDYWRAGISSSTALPHLDAAIGALAEAHGHLASGDSNRDHTAVMLGVLRCQRHAGHGGPVADRDEGIRLLEDGLPSVSGHPASAGLASVTLGESRMRRALAGIRTEDALLPMLRAGAPPETLADLDRAVECFHAAAAVPGLPQITAGAQGLARGAEAFRTLFRGLGSGPLDVQMDAMMTAMGAIRDLARTGSGLPGWQQHAHSIFDFDWTADVPSTEWPSGEMRDTGPPPEPRAPRRRPTFEVDVDGLRAAVRDLIGAEGGLPAALIRALSTDEPPFAVDDLVARAAGVVHGAAPTAADHLVLAVALHLRGRRDDGGWAAEDGTPPGDAEAAVTSLLAAAETVWDDDPDVLPVLIRLATLSPEGALAGLAARLGPLSDSLFSVGAKALCCPGLERPVLWDVKENLFALDVDQKDWPQPVMVVGDVVPTEPHDLAVSFVSSFSHLKALAPRPPRPVTQAPVFVANPRGDRQAAAVAAMLLRRSFYPSSVGLGGLIEDAAGPATAEEVRARLGASVLHVGCGVTPSGALELAHGTELDLAGTTAVGAGLAILPPGGFLPLADLLLLAGFTGVIGWREPVPEAVAAAAEFLVHQELVEQESTPVQAVRKTRRWLRAPDLSVLPPLLAAPELTSAGPDGEDWARFLVLRGR